MSTTAALRQRTVAAPGAALSLIEAGEAGRPTIVLVHGYPDGKELWVPVMERLSERFHVVAYDVRGAGKSTAPRGVRAYGFEQLAGDLAAVLDTVSPQRPVHLVGHDWGAIQGWELSCAPSLAPRIASFTAVAGPALGHVRAALRRQLRQGRLIHAASQLRHSWYIVGLCTPGVPTLVWRGVLGRGGWEAYLRQVERIPTEGTTPAATLTRGGIRGANLYRRNILLGFAGNRPARPQMPVQLIVPSGDRFVPPGYYEAVEDYVPTLRRRILAGSHWAPRAQPELVSRWIAEFAGEVDGQAAAAVPEGGIVPHARPWVRGGGLAQVRGRLALVTGA
ncbi:MAG: alpha/beta fold hydrolase, partial [Actinomycetota bacterium]|nr:alpha/beta fold hydrolase [Actinomycetota bacterium]